MEETYKEWIDKIAERHPYSIEETDEEWIDKIVESSELSKIIILDIINHDERCRCDIFISEK